MTNPLYYVTTLFQFRSLYNADLTGKVPTDVRSQPERDNPAQPNKSYYLIGEENRANMKQGKSVICHRWQSGQVRSLPDKPGQAQREDTTPNHPQAGARKSVGCQHQSPTLLPSRKETRYPL
jgi:hypothetical protein